LPAICNKEKVKKKKTYSENAMKENEKTDNLTDETITEATKAEDSAEQITSKENQDTQPSDENPNTPPVEEAPSIQDLEAMIFQWKDKYLRLSAEFDNYRKRTLKEKIELSRIGGEDVLKGLLPVVDDFERGLKNVEQAKDMEAVKEGMNLIYGKFKEFLNQKGLKEIEAVNVDFNTDFHEAITKIPVEDKAMSGKVIDVVQKGYTIDDKIIRYSKVVVGE
jgi:molecular chaperone GrpE